jgi:integral membrane sensor domain MASE1
MSRQLASTLLQAVGRTLANVGTQQQVGLLVRTSTPSVPRGSAGGPSRWCLQRIRHNVCFAVSSTGLGAAGAAQIGSARSALLGDFPPGPLASDATALFLISDRLGVARS